MKRSYRYPGIPVMRGEGSEQKSQAADQAKAYCWRVIVGMLAIAHIPSPEGPSLKNRHDYESLQLRETPIIVWTADGVDNNSEGVTSGHLYLSQCHNTVTNVSNVTHEPYVLA